MQLSREIIHELIHYDHSTGIFTWKERDRRWFETFRSFRSWNAQHAGKRAGGVRVNKHTGYQHRVVVILGHFYTEHRLAWIWMLDGPLPTEIDHKNRNATDNRWGNLRASTSLENARNASKRRDNTSGFTGVYWSHDTGKWRAGCRIKGKMVWLGLFIDIEDAASVAKEFRKNNGFDEYHGAEAAHYQKEAI